MIKAIEDFDGYFISDNGEVYCCLGKGNRNHNKRVPLYPIRPKYTTHGYARVCMRNNNSGKREDRYIHRLVAEHFIPNPDHKRYVNHKNCNRADNNARNLEWMSAKENTDYTMSMGHIVRNQKGQYESQYHYD